MLIEMNLQIFFNEPIIVYCDNKAAIEWMGNTRSSTKTRHVNLRFHFVRDEIEKGKLNVCHIETKYMVADFLTKAVTKDKLSWSLSQVNLLTVEEVMQK